MGFGSLGAIIVVLYPFNDRFLKNGATAINPMSLNHWPLRALPPRQNSPTTNSLASNYFLFPRPYNPPLKSFPSPFFSSSSPSCKKDVKESLYLGAAFVRAFHIYKIPQVDLQRAAYPRLCMSEDLGHIPELVWCRYELTVPFSIPTCQVVCRRFVVLFSGLLRTT